MYQSKIIAMIDKDEFIILQGNIDNIDTLFSETWFQEEKDQVCSFQLTNFRFYTHGSGNDLEMSSDVRNTLFPENWRQILQPIAKKQTIDFVEEYDIKSLKSFVKSTYTDQMEKTMYIPTNTHSVGIHYLQKCNSGQSVFAMSTTTAVIHHYRKNFGSSHAKFFRAQWVQRLKVFLKIKQAGVVFPYGPEPNWENTFKHLIYGKPDVREVNDTTMVRYADELAMRVHRTHQAVKHFQQK